MAAIIRGQRFKLKVGMTMCGNCFYVFRVNTLFMFQEFLFGYREHYTNIVNRYTSIVSAPTVNSKFLKTYLRFS